MADTAGTGSPRGALNAIGRYEYRNEIAALVVLAVAGWGLVSLKGSVPFGIGLLGGVSGATLALHAIGMALVYRSNRFLNFAQVQFGIAGATLFSVLVNARPIPRWIDDVCGPCLDPANLGPTGRNINYFFALALALGFSTGSAWLMHATVVRRFANAPRLILTVASVFSAQLLVGIASLIANYLLTEEQREQSQLSSAAPFPIAFDFRFGPATFSIGDVFLVAAALTAAVAVAMYLRFSTIGTSIRAASDNPTRAGTLGVDVNAVTGRMWLLAGLLSGIAGIAATMSASAPALGGTGSVSVSTLVPVLAAIVIARLTNLPLAVASAVVIGVLTQSMLFAFGSGELLDGLFVVIICALLLAQRFRAGRVDVDVGGSWRAVQEMRPIPAELRDLPSVRKWVRVGAVLTTIALLGYPWISSPSQTTLGAVYLILGIVGMSLLVLTGWAGQISLGQFAFSAVGAWAAASSGLPFLLAVPLGSVAGAVAAIVVGIPGLKLRGLHLAITTLAFAVAVPAVLLNSRYLGRWLPTTLERPALLGLDLDDARTFYYFSLLVLLVVIAAVRSMRRSRTARVLIAARDNEPAAQAFGVDLVRARLGAFAVSGFFAALAGTLYAYSQRSVAPDVYAPEQSLSAFMFTVIGGLGSLAGPLLGFLYSFVVATFGGTPLVAALSSFGGLLLVLLVPGGLAGLYVSIRDAMLRRIASRYRIVVPSLISEARLTSEIERVPLLPKMRPGGGSAFVPERYALAHQWLARPDRFEQPDRGERVTRGVDG